jgi:hypothetical protein
MTDGTGPSRAYGVASDSSAVARTRTGEGGESVRASPAPGPWVHALSGDGRVLCGAAVQDLLLWPGWTFGDISVEHRCPACRTLAA